MTRRNDLPWTARRTERGFTLIEIMVVVVILGLLATVVAQSVFGETDRARLAKVKADIKTIESACKRYRLHHNGRWPEDLNELVNREEGGEIYLEGGSIPKDPWNTEYRLDRDENGVVVVSDGPDQAPDSQDDITSRNMVDVTVEDLRRWAENQ